MAQFVAGLAVGGVVGLRRHSMNEIEYAITNLEEFLEADIGQGDLHMCSAEIALAALREKAERSKGCVWCKENNKVFHDGQHFHMFCSYCGKRLGGEP
jgi:hypothetical protein